MHWVLDDLHIILVIPHHVINFNTFTVFDRHSYIIILLCLISIMHKCSATVLALKLSVINILKNRV